MRSYTEQTLASVQQWPIMMLNEFAKSYAEKGQGRDLLLAVKTIPTLRELKSQDLLQPFLDISEDQKHQLCRIIQSQSQEDAMAKDEFRISLENFWGGCACELFKYKETSSSLNLRKVTQILGQCQEEYLARFEKYLKTIGVSEEQLATYNYFAYSMGTTFKELKMFQRTVLKTLDAQKEKQEVKEKQEEANISSERCQKSPLLGQDTEKNARVFKRKYSFKKPAISDRK